MATHTKREQRRRTKCDLCGKMAWNGWLAGWFDASCYVFLNNWVPNRRALARDVLCEIKIIRSGLERIGS